MNSKLISAIFLTACLFILSCQRPLIIDDDSPSGKANWELLNFQSERPLLGLHATPFELFSISENEFSRFNSNFELVEKRKLLTGNGVRGIPALSDNTFVRMILDNQSRQVIEFHLPRNPTQVIKILTDSLDVSSGDILEIESLTPRRLGAFSSDGTLFVLPARVLPSRHYALFIFEVLHNQTHDAFTSVKVIKRVELEALSSDGNNLVNVRFLGGNFYVTSKDGAWRIKPSGDKTKIINTWTIDAFLQKSDLFMTGLTGFDMNKSIDNGLSWEKLNINAHAELQRVEMTGDSILTQKVPGTVFYLTPTHDFTKAESIIYPDGVDPNAVIYYGTAFFGGNFFFSLDREIYFTDKLVLK
jgi:hypothetical protein